MMTTLLRFVDRLATGKAILVLVATVALFSGVIFPALAALRDPDGAGVKPLDLQFAYSPEQAFATIDSMGAHGRRVALAGELTVDVVYPLAYGLALAALLRAALRGWLPPASRLHALALLPLVVIVCDFAENLSIVGLIIAYPARPDGLALIASLFSTLKWALAGLSLVLLVLALLVWALRLSAARKNRAA